MQKYQLNSYHKLNIIKCMPKKSALINIQMIANLTCWVVETPNFKNLLGVFANIILKTD